MAREPQRRPWRPRPPTNYKLTGKGHNAPSPAATTPKFGSAIATGGLTAVGLTTQSPICNAPVFAEVSGLPAKFTIKNLLLLPVIGVPTLTGGKPITPAINYKLTATNHQAAKPVCDSWPAFAIKVQTQPVQFTIRSVVLAAQIGKPTLRVVSFRRSL